ncbi:MAG: class I SAM-dependent methyltransferase [Bacteroidota bacterium]
MSSFWDKRYSSGEYAYGTEPNHFFKTRIQHLTPGKMLLPGEGEGRNAAYAAESGWNVHAYDSSRVAAKKAAELSDSRNVAIKYHVADIKDIHYPEDEFNCVALIFLHLPPADRIPFHKKMLNILKPGGTLLLEAFTKKQLKKNSGGPRNMEMLYSAEELRLDFSSASNLSIAEVEINLNEGTYHQGPASLLRVVAVK